MVNSAMSKSADIAPLLAGFGLTKSFGSFVANKEIDFTIYPGELHALLGENGAGKSTFVKMIYGLLQPDSGHFEWQGRAVHFSNPQEARAAGIGMVFQHFSLFEAMSVVENIALALPPEFPKEGLAKLITQNQPNMVYLLAQTVWWLIYRWASNSRKSCAACCKTRHC